MATKFKSTNCEFMLHEDDWSEGEGKLVRNWTEELGEADSIIELLQKIPYLDKNFKKIERIQDEFEHDPCYDNETNRFDADLMVDIEDDGHDGVRIIKPTDEKYKLFTEGKVKLYALHILVHVKKECDIDVQDLVAEGWPLK